MSSNEFFVNPGIEFNSRTYGLLSEDNLKSILAKSEHPNFYTSKAIDLIFTSIDFSKLAGTS